MKASRRYVERWQTKKVVLCDSDYSNMDSDSGVNDKGDYIS